MNLLAKKETEQASDTPNETNLSKAMDMAAFEDEMAVAVEDIAASAKIETPAFGVPRGLGQQAMQQDTSKQSEVKRLITGAKSPTPEESAKHQIDIVKEFLQQEEADIADKEAQIKKLQADIEILKDKVNRGKAYLNPELKPRRTRKSRGTDVTNYVSPSSMLTGKPKDPNAAPVKKTAIKK